MKCETVRLKECYDCIVGGELDLLCLDAPTDAQTKWVRPMVVVVPGGAYRFVSKREGEPVAADFFAKGYQVAVLRYSCAPDGVSYPEQLYELACAVDYIKRKAARLSVNPKEIFLVGFSAGGHLVADYANEHSSLPGSKRLSLDTGVAGVGLAYPVIDDHDESFDNLLQGYAGEEKAALKASLRLAGRVNKSTPPTFLWTTAEDRLVPPQNTLRYALALSECKIPFELHVYPKGGHGMSNGSMEINDDKEAAAILRTWISDAARFFRDRCKEKV